jgi:hypothetical protein
VVLLLLGQAVEEPAQLLLGLELVRAPELPLHVAGQELIAAWI